MYLSTVCLWWSWLGLQSQNDDDIYIFKRFHDQSEQYRHVVIVVVARPRFGGIDLYSDVLTKNRAKTLLSIYVVLPGSATVPIPTNDDPNATILSLWRMFVNSPKYVYTTDDEPAMLKLYFKTVHV